MKLYDKLPEAIKKHERTIAADKAGAYLESIDFYKGDPVPNFVLPKDNDKCIKFLDDTIEKLEKEKVMKEASEGSVNNPIIYYFRDYHNRPMITVAVAHRHTADSKFNKLYYRGISICSVRDKPNKITGKNIAIGRLKAANWNEKSEMPINREEIEQLAYFPLNDGFRFKSAFDVELTKYERKLFKDLSKRRENYARSNK